MNKLAAVLALVLMAGLPPDASTARPRRSPAKPSGIPRAGAPVDPRAEMKRLVEEISVYAKSRRAGFMILPLNAEELHRRLPVSMAPDDDYLDSIDGAVIESLHFAPVDRERSRESTRRRVNLLHAAKKRDLSLLAIDYVKEERNIAAARRRAARYGFALFCADRRELDTVPAAALQPPAPDAPVSGGVRSFVYLINPGRYGSGEALASALAAAPADLVVVDPWLDRDRRLTARDVELMKRGAAGSRRRVIAYLSVGEAERSRSYWKKEWTRRPPAWVAAENPDWPGCYRVRYWRPEWRALLFGSPAAALDRILAQGFDGVALDTVDTFHWFEGAGRGALD